MQRSCSSATTGCCLSTPRRYHRRQAANPKTCARLFCRSWSTTRWTRARRRPSDRSAKAGSSPATGQVLIQSMCRAYSRSTVRFCRASAAACRCGVCSATDCRVVAGAVAASDGSLAVETRGHRLTLAVDPATGITAVTADQPVPCVPGLAVHITLGSLLPRYDCDDGPWPGRQLRLPATVKNRAFVAWRVAANGLSRGRIPPITASRSASSRHISSLPPTARSRRWRRSAKRSPWCCARRVVRRTGQWAGHPAA